MSAVRQSAALNSPGFENLKPRQLSDAIHQEIGYFAVLVYVIVFVYG